MARSKPGDKKMNTIKQQKIIVATGRHEYVVTAVIDGLEIISQHEHINDVQKRVSQLQRLWGCHEV